MTTARIGILGIGNMADAIVRGQLSRGVDPATFLAAARSPEKRERWTQELSIPTTADVQHVLACQTVLLCIKPQQLPGLIASVERGETGDASLLISILAGTPTQRLADAFPAHRIVRTMPNTPLLAGEGIVALCPGPRATDADLDTTRSLFAPAPVLTLDESQMDAVTAVSGSGPAYFYRLTELLAAAGEANGLPAEVAAQLATQTLIGAAALLKQSNATPAELRQKVTSPGGTTAAALAVFTEKGLQDTVLAAVTAATVRGREMSC